jgi:exodeoxyribonuclease-5
MTTTLTDQQQAGIERIRQWYHDQAQGFGADAFRLFGPAGTGKTTMAREIPAALGISDVRYGTFTGKAAHVLRGKGASPVSTIHSGIYFPTTSEEVRQRLFDARMNLAQAIKNIEKATLAGAPQQIIDELNDRGVELASEITVLEQESKRLAWEWNPDSEWAYADLLILDEVSMVGPKLAADIERYNVPVLVLGDPAQLPPVEGGGYYTNAEPDFLLTEIHRQALESPVLELATRIRLSADERLGLTPADVEPASVDAAMEADQVLVWSNKRRWAMLTVMRRKLGFPAGEVVEGDRIMCLTNSKELAVFNGQQFEVLSGGRLKDDEGHIREIAMYDDGFAGQEMQQQAKNGGLGIRGKKMLATYAQAITCHKAQGSEWDHVYVVDETPAMMSMVARREGREAAVTQARQWAYTAVSRASERITWARAGR